MLFNSYLFILVWLPLTLAVFYALGRGGHKSAAIWWINLVSFAFYATWEEANPLFLALSIAVNFMLGYAVLGMRGDKAAKAVAVFGITLNLLALAVFKYAGFIVENINAITHAGLPPPQISMPMGISFFIFTQIAFLVDCLRKRDANYRYAFRDYVFFVSFFPHLLAGPILYHRRIIPQLYHRAFGTPQLRRLSIGLLIFCFGLMKKLLIADELAPYVGPFFEQSATIGMVAAWAAALLYTFQLYFDFSAYSDMAVGIGMMLGVRLPFNFNSPYKSRSIIEFWRRWHRSLSFFLKNYLYIPLGGNRHGEVNRLRNLMLTMMLGGLWHGAEWNFLIWGTLHGVYLVGNHLWRARAGYKPLHSAVAWGVTFLAVVIAWVPFRAATFAQSLDMLSAMAGLRGLGSTAAFDGSAVFYWLIFCLAWVLLLPNSQQVAFARRPKRWIYMAAGFGTALSMLHFTRVSEFIYFRF